jgi:16S rRNA (uracil1498-N3)-methyltransferase
MVRIFAPPESLAGDRAILDEAGHRHLIKVLRLSQGDALRVFDGQGWEIDAIIDKIDKKSVGLILGDRRQLPLPAASITLWQSPPKNDRMDYIVQKTTELGVTRIVPVLTRQGILRPSADKVERWRTIAMEAARQCGRADIPRVDNATELAEALTEIQPSVHAIMLWEEERSTTFRQALASGPKQVALLVGPEGGFSQGEADACQAAGFIRASMGPRILRADTAAIVAVALAQSAAGGLD